MRRLILSLLLLLVVVGCSSEPAEHDISFQESFHSATGESIWTAAGPAVDDGVICAEASRVGAIRFETPDGDTLTQAEVGMRNDQTEPFSYVASGDMVCSDGSGTFVMSTSTEATNPAAFEMTATWEIEGGEGYEGVTGEGTVDEMSIDGDPVVVIGTSSGVVRAS